MYMKYWTFIEYFLVSLWIHVERMKPAAAAFMLKALMVMWGSFVSTACHHALIVSWASVIIIPPNTASLDLLNKHLITWVNHPHPISYAFIWLYKVKFVLLTYNMDQKPQMPTQFLILKTRNERKIPKPSEHRMVFSSGKWGIFPPIPNGFSVPGHTEGLSHRWRSPWPRSSVCWVWTQVFIPPSPLSQGQMIRTGLYRGEQWWGVTAQETSEQGRRFGLNIGGGRVWNGPFLKFIYFCLNVFFFFVKLSFVLSIHNVGWLRNCNKVIG